MGGAAGVPQEAAELSARLPDVPTSDVAEPVPTPDVDAAPAKAKAAPRAGRTAVEA